MKCVILQPSYIPWRGFFHQVQKADVFVFYDDVQYDKHGWRNRNRIKTSNGTTWLTVPVKSHGTTTEGTLINTVAIDSSQRWQHKHWSSIKQSYAKARYFATYAPLVESFYHRHDNLLADFTIDTTIALARAIGISHTQFVRSSSLGACGAKTARLIDLLQRVDATHYISGPSARDYIEPERFEEAGISLEYMKYDYAEYPQLHPPFDPQVSILDLLFSVGEDAGKFIWGEQRAD